MKFILILALLGVGGYFAYNHFQNRQPETIENPVYAEFRVDAKAGGREIDMLLLGEAADEADCRERGQRAWQGAMSACQVCTLQVSTCKAELEPRYLRMFANEPIPSTYMAFTRGAADERNGRMVIFGLTADEGDAICEMLKSQITQRYQGTIECIRARRD